MSFSSLTGGILPHDDPAIRYEGDWTHDNVFLDEDSGKEKTFSSTTDPNASVTYTTEAPIVAFMWWGFKSSQGGQHFIRICEGYCNVTNANWNRVDSFDPTDRTVQSKPTPRGLYGQAFPTPAIETVQIVNINDTRTVTTGFSQMTVVYLWMMVGRNTSSSTGITSSTGPASQIPLIQYNPPTSPNSKALLGPVIGGLVGGLSFLFLLFWVIFLYHRAKRRRTQSSQLEMASSNSVVNASHITPFVGFQAEGTSSVLDSSHALQGRGQPVDEHVGLGPPLEDQTAYVVQSLGSSGIQLHINDLPSLPSSRRRERDGGPIALDFQEINSTLPPDYGDIVWGHQNP